MASEGRSIFRAIADFSALRREARATSKDLDDLKGKTRKSSDGLKDHEKQTDKSSSALSRFGAALSSARRKMDEFGSSNAGKKLDELDGKARKLIGTVAGLVSTLAKMSLVAVAATAAVGPVISLVGAIGALSGVVGVLPGVLAAAAVGAGALKLAFSGVDDVMSAVVTQDAKKFEEAIKGMPPAMQEAMRAAYTLGPALISLRKGVQETFWQGLNKTIEATGKTYIPLVGNALVGAARGANQFVKEVGAFLLQKKSIEDFRAGTFRISDAFTRLKGVGTSVAQVFIDIFSVSTRFLGPLADGIRDAADKFAKFIHQAAQDGSLEKWIQTGIDQFKALLGVVKNVGSIVFSLFKGASAAGAGFFKTLERVTGDLADFLKSAQGQTAIKDIFTAAQKAAGVLLPIIKALFSALGVVVPILVDIGEKIGPGVESVIRGLAKAFDVARPGLEKLGTALGEFLTALGDAGPLVGALANGVSDVLSPVIDALTWLIKALVDIFDKLPKPVQDFVGDLGGLAIAGGLAIIGLNKVIDVGKSFITAFDNVRGAVSKAIDKLKDWIGWADKAKKADAGEAVGGAAAGKKKKGLGALGSLGVAGALTAGAVVGQDALGLNDTDNPAKSNLNAATGGNLATATHGVVGQGTIDTKGLVEASDKIAGIMAKIKQPFLDFTTWLSTIDLKKPFLDFTTWLSTTALPAIKQPFLDFTVWLSETWTTISTGISDAWTAIGDWLASVWDAIVLGAEAKWQGLVDWWNGLWAGISEAWSAFWGGIGDFFSGLWDGITLTAQAKWQGLVDWWNGLWAGISEAWTSFWGSIGEFFSMLWDGITATATEKWSAFTGWLSGLWGSISQTARDVWNGITTGIKDAVNVAVTFISDRWNGIKNWLSDTWSGLKNTAKLWWDAIKNAVVGPIQEVGRILGSIWDGIASTASAVWEKIKKIVGDAVQWVKDTAASVGNTALNIITFGMAGHNKGGWIGGKGAAGPNKDTEPVLATPGEFMVSRVPAKANAPTLEAINGGASAEMVARAAALNAGFESAVSSMAGGGAAPSTVRPAVAAGLTVGQVTVIQNVQNPLPEKPSVTLTKRVARLSSLGLQAASAN
jgi:phage-related protein